MIDPWAENVIVEDPELATLPPRERLRAHLSNIDMRLYLWEGEPLPTNAVQFQTAVTYLRGQLAGIRRLLDEEYSP